MIKKSTISGIFIFFLLSCSLLLSFPRPLNSVPPTSVKDTLSSSQLSYFANLDTGNSISDTLITIELSGNPSNTSNNLFVGDTLSIGDSSTTALSTYIVRDVGNTAQIQINTGLSAENLLSGAAVIATHSAIHTVSFTPKSSITGGAWQFLVKASSRTGESQQDGIPDQQGFDLGQDVGATIGTGTRLKTADIACPFGASASVGTTAVISTNSYHIVKCNLGAGVTNPIDVGASMVIGRALASGSQLINPAPALSHTEGQADSSADVYTFYVRQLDAADAVVDANTIAGKIAVVEAVRVTATVDPTITFAIGTSGVGNGETACGNALDSAADSTTATSIAFGSLTLAAFNDLAHHISCVTNADNGYVVTVYEIDQMEELSSGTTIPDTNCDGSCTADTATEWTSDDSHSEWGYSIENINVGVSVFHYNQDGATFAAKAFGEGTANAKQIMTNTTTPSSTETAFVCYRLTTSTTQEAGNYENQLIFTANATF